MKAEWDSEKEAIQAVQNAKASIEDTRAEAERAQRESDLQRAAELTYGELPKLERELEEASVKLSELQSGTPLLKEEVGAEDIAEVVAAWTGIPVSRLLEGEMEKLVHMESRLHERVIGQTEAVEAVSNAIRRSRAGLGDPDRPIGSFIFLGPTGVGKTELAKALAEFLFDDREGDGADRHVGVHGEALRLAARGCAPGLRGLRRGRPADRGRAAKAVLGAAARRDREGPSRRVQRAPAAARRRAHDRWAGPHGGLRNTIVIMTSNATSLEAVFRPEFLNRIDDIVRFKSLEREQLAQIVRLQVDGLRKRLSERGISLELTDAAAEVVIEKGYDPVYGARPLKRTIQRELENPLALMVLSGSIADGDTARADAEDGAIQIVVTHAAEAVAAA